MSAQLHTPNVSRDPTGGAVRAFALAALVGLAGSVAAVLLNARHFAFSYLTAFMFCASVVLGMMFFVLLHHLVDAGWSTVVRRPAEQFLAAVPALAGLFLPVVLTMRYLFKWTDHAAVGGEHLYQVKAPFLNEPFFIGRAAAYFLIWFLIAGYFRGGSLRQDRTADPAISLRLRGRAAPAMLLYAMSATFAGIDWVMTLDYHWFSTIFGVYIFAGCAVSALAVLTLVVLAMAPGGLRHLVHPNHLHDLGKLVFAFSVFWAYIAFSQFFLIWYANIPEETGWMLARWHGGWKVSAVLMSVLMFALPFVMLMPAGQKRKGSVLATACVMILGGHYLELRWLILPVLAPDGVPAGRVWMEISALLLCGGVTGWVVVRAMNRSALYPRHDPRLAEALAGGHEHPPARRSVAASESRSV